MIKLTKISDRKLYLLNIGGKKKMKKKIVSVLLTATMLVGICSGSENQGEAQKLSKMKILTKSL